MLNLSRTILYKINNPVQKSVKWDWSGLAVSPVLSQVWYVWLYNCGILELRTSQGGKWRTLSSRDHVVYCVFLLFPSFLLLLTSPGCGWNRFWDNLLCHRELLTAHPFCDLFLKGLYIFQKQIIWNFIPTCPWEIWCTIKLFPVDRQPWLAALPAVYNSPVTNPKGSLRLCLPRMPTNPETTRHHNGIALYCTLRFMSVWWLHEKESTIFALTQMSP